MPIRGAELALATQLSAVFAEKIANYLTATAKLRLVMSSKAQPDVRIFQRRLGAGNGIRRESHPSVCCGAGQLSRVRMNVEPERHSATGLRVVEIQTC